MDIKKGNPYILRITLFLMAEGQGFEPWVPLDTPVFKTGAFDHSAIPPVNLFGGSANRNRWSSPYDKPFSF